MHCGATLRRRGSSGPDCVQPFAADGVHQPASRAGNSRRSCRIARGSYSRKAASGVTPERTATKATEARLAVSASTRLSPTYRTSAGERPIFPSAANSPLGSGFCSATSSAPMMASKRSANPSRRRMEQTRYRNLLDTIARLRPLARSAWTTWGNRLVHDRIGGHDLIGAMLEMESELFDVFPMVGIHQPTKSSLQRQADGFTDVDVGYRRKTQALQRMTETIDGTPRRIC